jgi:hypothetical protein
MGDAAAVGKITFPGLPDANYRILKQEMRSASPAAVYEVCKRAYIWHANCNSPEDTLAANLEGPRTMTTLPPPLRFLKHSSTLPWAGACYVALLGFLIYTLAHEARLDSWRSSAAPITLSAQRINLPAPDAACAELAGMGQKLCSAEARLDAARSKFQQRITARQAVLDQRALPSVGESRAPLSANHLQLLSPSLASRD